MAILLSTLPVIFKQRDNRQVRTASALNAPAEGRRLHNHALTLAHPPQYPAWAFMAPTMILRLPYSLVCSGLWTWYAHQVLRAASAAGCPPASAFASGLTGPRVQHYGGLAPPLLRLKLLWARTDSSTTCACSTTWSAWRRKPRDSLASGASCSCATRCAAHCCCAAYALHSRRQHVACAQFALALFWLNASITRSLVIATTAAWLSFLLIFLLGGFVLAKGAPPRGRHAAACAAGHGILCLGPASCMFADRHGRPGLPGSSPGLQHLHVRRQHPPLVHWRVRAVRTPLHMECIAVMTVVILGRRYWALPMAWLQNAIEVNEFSAPRWQTPYVYNPSVRHQASRISSLVAAWPAWALQLAAQPEQSPSGHALPVRLTCTQAGCAHAAVRAGDAGQGAADQPPAEEPSRVAVAGLRLRAPARTCCPCLNEAWPPRAAQAGAVCARCGA